MTMENFRQLMEIIGTAVDGVGVCIVAAGAIVATARLLVRRVHNTGNYYSSYRQDIGRAILLGLEFLIAGDIIRTVVVAPTIQNVLVLGLIVLIRTFLSLSLQLEIEGKIAVAPRRSRPRLRLIFPSRKQRALVTASREQWLNCSSIGARALHPATSANHSATSVLLIQPTARQHAHFRCGHFASKRIGFHTFCSGASEHASAFCSI